MPSSDQGDRSNRMFVCVCERESRPSFQAFIFPHCFSFQLLLLLKAQRVQPSPDVFEMRTDVNVLGPAHCDEVVEDLLNAVLVRIGQRQSLALRDTTLHFLGGRSFPRNVTSGNLPDTEREKRLETDQKTENRENKKRLTTLQTSTHQTSFHLLRRSWLQAITPSRTLLAQHTGLRSQRCSGISVP